MRRAARVDDNQQTIVKELRKFPGLSVWITSALGKGFPDICVGFLRQTFLYEIKAPAKPKSAQKLTRDERLWHGAWHGHVKTVTTAGEIIADITKRTNWSQ